MADDGEWDQALADALDADIYSDEDQPPPAKQPRLDQQDLVPAGSQAAAAAAAPPAGALALVLLPREVLMRVLAFLAAPDLTALAACCRAQRELSSEETLWRRLYCARWGRQRSNSSTRRWKELYMLRDGEEMHAASQGAPQGMKEIYVQMQLAKRQQVLGRGQVDDLMPVESRVAEQLAAWRRARGFAPGSEAQRPPDLLQREYHFHRIGASVFCCEETGWVHVCDETCRERIVDSGSDLLVCPISGRMSDRMMTEAEVQADEDRYRRPGGEEHEQEVGGRLAKAYLAGYNCADERELAQVHGACFAGQFCV